MSEETLQSIALNVVILNLKSNCRVALKPSVSIPKKKKKKIDILRQALILKTERFHSNMKGFVYETTLKN